MAGSQPSGQKGQGSPTQLVQTIIEQFKSQGDQIDTSQLRQQQSRVHDVCTQVVSASGAQQQQLQEAGTHRTLMGESRLPEWAKADFSQIMWLTSRPEDYGTDQRRVEQALTQQIQPLSQIMTQVGLSVPSDVTSFAESSGGSQQPRSGQRGY